MGHITGAEGTLTAGGRLAARLVKWDCSPSEIDPIICATVQDTDVFWLAQSPLMLSLRVGKRQWIWKDVAVTEIGDKFTIRGHGRPEIR